MSLFRLLKKRGRILTPECGSGADNQVAGDLGVKLASLARHPEMILVNIQSVVNDLVVGPNQLIAIDWRDTPQATPPFPGMWLEAHVFGNPLAIQVLRESCHELVNCRDEHRPAEMVESHWKAGLFYWNRHNGEIMGPVGQTLFWLDESGTILRSSTRMIGGVDPAHKREAASGCELFAYLAAHALARMNCRNVVLRSITSPKVARRHQRDIVPATVWHEIRITNVPQIRTTGRGVLGRDESKMRRFWVRGHYADYRNGAGLFGNPKLQGVFWIPEHQRGNAELGDVIPEYTLA
jgi:hypothetical protein